MGGQETLQHLREQRPEIPVIVMSGYTEHEVAAQLMDGTSGAVGFLQKPFLPEDLVSALRHASLPASA
jgi:CheY-like chemotaxis protein